MATTSRMAQAIAEAVMPGAPSDRSSAAFYDRTALWWGTTTITERDRQRAALIAQVPGGPHHVLEIGAGFGGAAAATADLGHDVLALELSSTRATIARRHELKHRAGTLEVREVDFAAARLVGPYDVIAFWSGFGSGGDPASESTLRKISALLRPGGRAFIDVFDPTWWLAAHGTETVVHGIHRLFRFDPDSVCFEIICWPEGRQDQAVSEFVSCYYPGQIRRLAQSAALVVVDRKTSSPADPAGAPSYLLELTKP